MFNSCLTICDGVVSILAMDFANYVGGYYRVGSLSGFLFVFLVVACTPFIFYFLKFFQNEHELAY